MTFSLRARVAATALAASLGALTISGPAAAQADTSRGTAAGQGMHGGMHGGQMEPGMGGGQGGMGGMMGMMDMMRGCSQMMQGGKGGHGLPQLPPGNEKLQLQMHADLMRAMGEILTKYAARLPDSK